MLHVVAFIASVVCVYLGMQYYIAWWTLRHFPNLPVAPGTLRILLLLVALSFPLGMWLLRSHSTPFTRAFAWLSFIWLGASFLMLSSAVLGDLLETALRWSRWAGPAHRGAAWGVLLLAAFSVGWSLFDAARVPRVREVEVRLPRLPRELDGLRVVQLSDLHLGLSVSLDQFERILERVKGLSPDLVVFTGDLLDPGFAGEERLASQLAGLAPRLGVLSVFGNHEHYHGVDASLASYRRSGLPLLRGEVRVLPGGLQVAGIDDQMAARLDDEDVGKVLGRLDPAKPSILLSHQPLRFELAAEKGVGLMLSGHTHRGQLFPFTLLVRAVYKRVYGPYRSGASTLYVSPGAGNWGPPMRFLAPAEIVLLRLRAP
ncbi:MAG: metallophosphoesterase [Elusimicrobiota bacterium]|jgi:hypothetical protein